jgi:hypothetical protein
MLGVSFDGIFTLAMRRQVKSLYKLGCAVDLER